MEKQQQVSILSTSTLRLADALKRREIREIVYFHCDHWEPWKTEVGMSRTASLPVMAERVTRFVDVMQSREFARRLTLFYKPGVYSALDDGSLATKGVKVHPDDRIVFLFLGRDAKRHGREAMRYLVSSGAHGIELHLHHEGFTHNTAPSNALTGAYLASPRARAFEEARLDLALRLVLDTIRSETGKPLDRWFFVHGHWALQASDPTVCHLVREIEILAANGCKGDFTFPAGRRAVNPRLEVPYFIAPVNGARGYDLPEAQPELAYGNSAAAPRKFFIWASLIKHRGCSLDYYAPWVRQWLENSENAVLQLIEQSYAIDHTLFIKTHAHSMHPNYFDTGTPPAFPLAEPAVQQLFGTLFEAAAAAHVRTQFLTAAEVYDRFTTAKHNPVDGFALRVVGPAADASDIHAPPMTLDLSAARPLDPWQTPRMGPFEQ
jgi:hypothetical protein